MQRDQMPPGSLLRPTVTVPGGRGRTYDRMSPSDRHPRSRSAADGGAVPEQQRLPDSADAPSLLGPAKLARPPQPENLIHRQALVRQLRQAKEPVIVVQGSAGYGKTALLRQWSDADPRAFSWLSLDEGDNDPLVLLAYLLAALDVPAQARDRLLAGPLADPAFLRAVTIPGLIEFWASRVAPLVLVLDDVEALRDDTCWTLIVALAEGVPEGSHLVLAGRREPPLPLSRWLANSQLLWVREPELGLTPAESADLLATRGIRLDPVDASRLRNSTRGWPAAVALAGIYLAEADDVSAAITEFSGAVPPVGGYLRDEVLGDLPPQLLRFLERTSVLSVLAAEPCDAVLDAHGSGELLNTLLDAGVIQSTGNRDGFRCHPLLREMLSGLLRQQEPELVPLLPRRAAGWLRRAGGLDEAIEQARRSGDRTLAADLLWESLPAQLSRGGRGVLEG